MNLIYQLNLILENDYKDNEDKNLNISTTLQKSEDKAWEVNQKKLLNKVLKKNLRNILYEFMDCNKDKVWPERQI